MAFIKIGDPSKIVKVIKNADEPKKVYYDEEGNIKEEPTFEDLTIEEVVNIPTPKGKD